MTVTIHLSDDEAANLEARAAAAGLTLQAWLQKRVAEESPLAPGTLQAAANIVLEEMRQVPPEIMATLPQDGAGEHDHYLYGWPKKEG